MARSLARLALIPVALLVLYGTLGPAPTYPGDPATYGALAHALASALLLVLARLATGASLRLLAPLALMVALGIELAQAVRPGRTPEVADLLFDAAGVLSGLVLIRLPRLRRSRARADRAARSIG